jgi:hypothetical protein
MTTGNKVVGGDPLNTSPPPGHYLRRAWSGGDGRKEPFAGGERDKWNDYQVTITQRDVSHQTFDAERWINYPGGPAIWVPYSDTFGFSPEGSFALSNNVILKAQSKLLSRIKGHSFNMAVNLAEMNKTASMLATTLSKFGKAIMALKRGDFATAARQLGVQKKTSKLKSTDISGRWLELQYGWMPAVDDAYEAAKAFESISQGPRTARFYAKGEDLAPIAIGENSVGPLKWSTRHYRKYTILCELTEELSFERQLGLLDPASVLWEITPYSFVVDWFVPFGTYLDNLNQIPKLKGRFLTTSTYEVNIHSIRTTAAFNALPDRRLKRLPSVAFQQKTITRNVASGLTVPSPSFNSLYDALEPANRFKNALALAYQAVRR